MTLDNIPGKKVFVQRDVRETPAATATATAVGLTGESYVLVGAGGTDLTAERTLTAGEGINLNDAGAGSTITIVGENASTTNKGIASFADSDFQVASGVVTLDADIISTVDGDSGTATGAVHNLDILGGGGITTAGASNDITISLTNKTSYWSCPGSQFKPNDSMNEAVCDDGQLAAQSGNIFTAVGVTIPNGAVVTGAVVYGAVSDETWTLERTNLSSGATSTLASAAIDTEDTSIDNATIDNSTYGYFLATNGLDEGELIYGARITYTTDYD